MHRSTGQQPAVTIDIGIHKVQREKHVVVLYRRPQKLRDLIVGAQRQTRQMSGSAMIQALLSKSDRLYIPKSIKDGEAFAGFQHTSAVIRQRRSRQDVKLIFDLDNIFQN
jgi:hypothetical protein